MSLVQKLRAVSSLWSIGATGFVIVGAMLVSSGQREADRGRRAVQRVDLFKLWWSAKLYDQGELQYEVIWRTPESDHSFGAQARRVFLRSHETNEHWVFDGNLDQAVHRLQDIGLMRFREYRCTSRVLNRIYEGTRLDPDSGSWAVAYVSDITGRPEDRQLLGGADQPPNDEERCERFTAAVLSEPDEVTAYRMAFTDAGRRCSDPPTCEGLCCEPEECDLGEECVNYGCDTGDPEDPGDDTCTAVDVPCCPYVECDPCCNDADPCCGSEPEDCCGMAGDEGPPGEACSCLEDKEPDCELGSDCGCTDFVFDVDKHVIEVNRCKWDGARLTARCVLGDNDGIDYGDACDIIEVATPQGPGDTGASSSSCGGAVDECVSSCSKCGMDVEFRSSNTFGGFETKTESAVGDAGKLFKWIRGEDTGVVPEHACGVYPQVTFTEYALQLADQLPNGALLGKVTFKAQTGVRWSTNFGGGYGGFKEEDLKEVTIQLRVKKDGCSTCGDGPTSPDPSNDGPTTAVTYGPSDGVAGGYGGEDSTYVPAPQLSYRALAYQAFGGECMANGPLLEYFEYAGTLRIGVPGLGQTNTTVLNRPGGTWTYTGPDWTGGDYAQFMAVVTGPDGIRYIYKADDASATTASDWNGHFIPLSEVRQPVATGGALIETYINEPVPGQPLRFRTIERQHPDGYGLLYDHDPDQPYTMRVTVDTGGQGAIVDSEMSVAFDGHWRLTDFTDGCGSCGDAESIIYTFQMPGQPPSDRILRRLDENGQQIVRYEYDADGVKKVFRGSPETLVYERSIEGTDELRKYYVDSTAYELRRLSSVGGVFSDTVYEELNGQGDSYTTTLGFNPSSGALEITSPDAVQERIYFGGPDGAQVIRRETFDGSTAKMVSLATFTTANGKVVPDVKTNTFGGQTDYDYYADGQLERVRGPRFWDFGDTSTPYKRSETNYEYDPDTELLQFEKRMLPSGDEVVTKYEYDPQTSLVTKRIRDEGDVGDHLNLTTEYIYDGLELTEVHDPRGIVHTRTYDELGRLRQMYTRSENGQQAVSETQYYYDGHGRVILVRRAGGAVPFAAGAPTIWHDTAYEYDDTGRLHKVIRQPVVTFADGEVASISSDAGSRVIEYVYDLQNRVVRTIRPDSSWSAVEHDGRGLVYARVTGYDSYEILRESIDHDATGRVTTVTAPTGRVTSYGYDGFGRRQTMTEGVGVTHYEYADHARPTRVWTEDTTTGDILSDEVRDYDRLGRVWRTRQRIGDGDDNGNDRIHIQLFDVLGRMMRRVDKGPGNSAIDGFETGDRVTARVHDDLGRLKSQAMWNGDPQDSGSEELSRTEYEHDAGSNPIEERVLKTVVDGTDQFVTTFTTYDELGQPMVETDPEGHEVHHEYDGLSRLIIERSLNSSGAALQQRRWVYDALGQLERTVTFADADDEGSVDVAEDRVEDRTYHAGGYINTSTTYNMNSAAPLTTTFYYDGIGRQTAVFGPVSSELMYHILSGPHQGLVDYKVVIDGLGSLRTQYQYDDRDRVTHAIQHGPLDVLAIGEDDLVNQFGYDAMGRRTLEIDAAGMRTQYRYNRLGDNDRMTEAEGTLDRITDRVFDRLGRLHMLKAYDDAQVQTTVYDHDAANRQTKIAFPDSVNDTDTVRLDYNLAGWLTRRIDQRGVIVDFEYDDNGLVTDRDVTSAPAGIPAVNDEYGYDGLGRMISATRIIGPDQVSHTVRAYTDLSYVDYEDQTLFGGETKRIDYDSDQSGNRIELTYPEDLNVTLDYAVDAVNRVEAIKRNDVTLVEYVYTGEYLDTRTTITTAGKHIVRDLGYDDHRRINSIENRVTDPATILMNYTLPRDKVGNVDEIVAMGPGQRSVDYTHDDLHRLYTATYSAGAETFHMDELGNRDSYADSRPGGVAVAYGANNAANEYLTVAGAAIIYDAAGNIVQDERGHSYVYDADDRLIQANGTSETLTLDYDALGRRIRSSDGISTTLFYYDEIRILAEYDDQGGISRYYVEGSQYLDEHVLQHAGGTDAYYLVGHAYSVVGVADADGSITAAFGYDSYGNVDVPLASNPYYFTGRRVDMLGNMPIYDYRNRWFDPEHGRFGQRDPLGHIDGNNLYEYVTSAPARYVDPLGLQKKKKKTLAEKLCPPEDDWIILTGGNVSSESTDSPYEIVYRGKLLMFRVFALERYSKYWEKYDGPTIADCCGKIKVIYNISKTQTSSVSDGAGGKIGIYGLEVSVSKSSSTSGSNTVSKGLEVGPIGGDNCQYRIYLLAERIDVYETTPGKDDFGNYVRPKPGTKRYKGVKIASGHTGATTVLVCKNCEVCKKK